MGLVTKITASVSADYGKALDLSVVSSPTNYAKVVSLANGTGDKQADRIFTDTRTLAASGTEDLDLAGVLVDAFGQTLTFVKVKAVLVAAALGNTNNVNVTRPASNGLALFLAASDGLAVRPGGMFMFACSDNTAVPVAAGTGDLLTITNSAAGTPVTYDVIIVGTSA